MKMTDSAGMPEVFHAVISLAPGGLERMVVNLANERNRHQSGSTMICCLDELGDMTALVDPVIRQGKRCDAVFCLDAKRNRFPWDLKAVGRLRNETGNLKLERSGDDCSAVAPKRAGEGGSLVFHAHNLAAWQYAVLAARGTGARVVYTQHGPNPHNLGLLNRLRVKILMRYTQAIVAVSEDTAREMGKLGVPRGRIAVVPNGISRMEKPPMDADERRLKRQGMGIPQDAFVIGSVGRFSAEKNYSMMVKAFALFHQKHSDSCLVLVGDGPDRLNVEKAVRDQKLEGACILPGMREDAVEWLSTMDVFCLSSLSEGTSVSLLNAGSCGIPCVVTDVGGNPEVVKDGVTGIVVSSGSANELATAFEKLCMSPDLRRSMGQCLHNRILADYSLDTCLDAYEKIYEGVNCIQPVSAT